MHVEGGRVDPNLANWNQACFTPSSGWNVHLMPCRDSKSLYKTASCPGRSDMMSGLAPGCISSRVDTRAHFLGRCAFGTTSVTSCGGYHFGATGDVGRHRGMPSIHTQYSGRAGTFRFVARPAQLARVERLSPSARSCGKLSSGARWSQKIAI